MDMTDQMERALLDLQSSPDSLYQQIVLLSAGACSWAESMLDGMSSVLLWLRERDDFPHGIPYRVDQRRVEQGVWRIVLVAEADLPAGVCVQTRDELLRALTASSVAQLSLSAVDQVVQCGLFGEVFYR
jgi:hypothetical protein